MNVTKEAGVVRIVAYTDSKLVEGQVTREYEAKENQMKKYMAQVLELVSHFNAIKVQHIPRSQNEHANRLTRLASNKKYVTRN